MPKRATIARNMRFGMQRCKSLSLAINAEPVALGQRQCGAIGEPGTQCQAGRIECRGRFGQPPHKRLTCLGCVLQGNDPAAALGMRAPQRPGIQPLCVLQPG